jgi:hypothetical protein
LTSFDAHELFKLRLLPAPLGEGKLFFSNDMDVNSILHFCLEAEIWVPDWCLRCTFYYYYFLLLLEKNTQLLLLSYNNVLPVVEVLNLNPLLY